VRDEWQNTVLAATVNLGSKSLGTVQDGDVNTVAPGAGQEWKPVCSGNTEAREFAGVSPWKTG
jgi:hypothetical protein